MSLVTLTVQQLVAPAPDALQQTGALVSQGGTNLTAGTYALLTTKTDYTNLQPTALSISTATWSGGVVTVTTTAAIPGLTTGDKFPTTLTGFTPVAYNGLVTATVTGASAFTYPLAASPGNTTGVGVYTPPGVGELQAMINSFFGQGGIASVYVLELGQVDKTTGPTALGTFITAQGVLQQFYSYLVPRGWDASSNYLSLIAQYESTTAKTYFFTTTTSATYTSYTAQMKDVLLFVEAPTIALTEFSAAAAFNAALTYNPGPNQKMTSYAGKFLNGVTPYPVVGNQSLITTLQAANVTVIGTGVEGGISTATIGNSLFTTQGSGPGRTLDGRDFSYWFEVDFVATQLKLQLANYIENNGPNNTVNPLGYNQDGIDRLRDVATSFLAAAASFGVLQGTIVGSDLTQISFTAALNNETFEDQNVVNVVPFVPYNQLNPGDYANGIYKGMTVVIIPQSFFQQVVVNMLVENLI